MTRHLTAEDLWSIPRVGEPVALTDGDLLVPVRTFDPDTDEGITRLWRVDPSSGDSTAVTTGDATSPAVAWEGSSVAFLRRVGEQRQVHVQSLTGGEPRAVTDLPRGAIGARWTPAGRLLVLASLSREEPSIDGTRRLLDDPKRVTAKVSEDAVYRYWDGWLDEVLHLVLVDPAGGDPIDLMPGSTKWWRWPATDDPIVDLDISPDGSSVLFCVDDSSPPHRRLSWSLFHLDLPSGTITRLDEGRDGHSTRPRFTPDGSSLVYGYREDPEFYADRLRLIWRDVEGSHQTILADGWDRSPDSWTFDADARLLVVAEDEARSRLWRLALGSGMPEPLTTNGWVTHPAVGRDGTIFVLHDSLSSPPEVSRLVESGLDPVTAFTAPAIEDVSWGDVSEHTIEGAGGEPIQMWLVDPPGTDGAGPLPLVHLIHGGPHGVFGDQWHWRWSSQVIAAGGYRVALVNFHGSTGRGQEFATSIQGAWGDRPFRDIEAATDHLVSRGLADEDRLAVAGGSYGGYLTALIIGRTDRYACAIAHAAVTNLGGMYASDLTLGRAQAFGAEIWEDRQAIERWSPSTQAAGYSTPTLVVHGDRDYRVPVTQGLELYGVLVAKGVPARLVWYPDENHWVESRSNSIHWYGEVLEWLDRWL